MKKSSDRLASVSLHRAIFPLFPPAPLNPAALWRRSMLKHTILRRMPTGTRG
jgi:hypothetical protein